jgi:2-hydroxycyclohexanecarboxyl-CoA dehydrogenase
MGDTERRVAVVTGGARGIGNAIAQKLGALGYVVAILDIDRDGERVAKEMTADGIETRFYDCDVTNREQVQEHGSAIVGEFGPVAVLVNNAGWTPHDRFLEQDPELWSKIIAVNYEAVLNTCHFFAREMSERGSIVNISSDSARIGVANEAVYAGAKAAVVAFSKSLAVELGRKSIRVNVVSPGSTRTKLLESLISEEGLAARVKMTPLRKLADPNDIAGAVCFLAHEGSHITGQVLSVNGGATRV